MTDWGAIREAFADVARREGPDAGVIVRRVTRLSGTRAEALVQAIVEGRADGRVEHVTPAPGTPGSGGGGGEGGGEGGGGGAAFLFMYDRSGYDRSDGYGA